MNNITKQLADALRDAILCVDPEQHPETFKCAKEALASTVAELRAEVERLRKSNELYSFAMNTAGIDELKRRADAAERRVGELEAFVTAVRTECFDYWNEGIRPWPHHMQTLAWKADEVLKHATLTGADPT